VCLVITKLMYCTTSTALLDTLTYLMESEASMSFFHIYIRGSVHRNSRLKKSNEMQQYADIYLLLNYSTCFGRPSSGVHKTVVAASSIDRTVKYKS